MLNIQIDEYVNGFSLAVYDNKDGYVVRELHEERIEALKALTHVVEDLEKREYEKILNAVRQ